MSNVVKFISHFENVYINPLLPNVPQREPLEKFLILILEGIIKKNSYERRAYESVDEKSLF